MRLSIAASQWLQHETRRNQGHNRRSAECGAPLGLAHELVHWSRSGSSSRRTMARATATAELAPFAVVGALSPPQRWHRGARRAERHVERPRRAHLGGLCDSRHPRSVDSASRCRGERALKLHKAGECSHACVIAAEREHLTQCCVPEGERLGARQRGPNVPRGVIGLLHRRLRGGGRNHATSVGGERHVAQCVQVGRALNGEVLIDEDAPSRVERQPQLARKARRLCAGAPNDEINVEPAVVSGGRRALQHEPVALDCLDTRFK
mmetsp:Transcript_25735/g.70887  ORF Transcript_25735/g.70887 Transcript_25735/m.70887 type:complete len:265 (+) Transcript_25735:216-1010(+)